MSESGAEHNARGRGQKIVEIGVGQEVAAGEPESSVMTRHSRVQRTEKLTRSAPADIAAALWPAVPRPERHAAAILPVLELFGQA
jgi:hypothetical protein